MPTNFNDTTPAAPSGKTNVQWQKDGSGNVSANIDTPAGGTVTSVAVTAPAEFTVTGSPVTTSGTIAITKANETANAVYAGPTTGSAAAPTFRAIVPADLPVATTSAFGAVKPDNSTVTISGGVLSATGTGGTVTSVALSAPAEFSVSGSPVTSTGTLAITKANESANTVWAGPTSGGAAQPAFRALVAADLPGGTGTVSSVAMTVPSDLSVSGSPITTSGTFAITANTQTANTVKAGPTSGGAATPGYRALVAADLPIATTSAFGAVKPDNTTCTISAGVLSATGTGGSVTSVGLTMPTGFSVSGSPVTTSGTLAVTLSNESANTVWAGPTSGGATTPAFRALVAADLPVATTSDFGAVKPDNSTITISGGVISAAAASSPGNVLLGTYTASSSAALNIVTRNATGQSGAIFNTDYDEYRFEMVNIVPSNSGKHIIMQMSTDGGSTYDSTGGHYRYAGVASSTGGAGAVGNAFAGNITLDGAPGGAALSNLAIRSGLNGDFRIFNPLSGNNVPVLGESTYIVDGSPYTIDIHLSGFYDQTTAVNAFRLLTDDAGSGGTITSGKVRVYGYAK